MIYSFTMTENRIKKQCSIPILNWLESSVDDTKHTTFMSRRAIHPYKRLTLGYW
jgi:hypothetical protein